MAAAGDTKTVPPPVTVKQLCSTCKVDVGTFPYIGVDNGQSYAFCSWDCRITHDVAGAALKEESEKPKPYRSEDDPLRPVTPIRYVSEKDAAQKPDIVKPFDPSDRPYMLYEFNGGVTCGMPVMRQAM